ncbi:hypothetical protein T492DRAFT_1147833 [Pavlovales sp. CCMP2436]|nr:hypothetical protein T492DRAFT_1147833 [Pavlovales sp. CCMP2436]
MRSIHVGSSWLCSMLRKHPGVAHVAKEWFKHFRCCIRPLAGHRTVLAKTRKLDKLGMNKTCNSDEGGAENMWGRALGAWVGGAAAAEVAEKRRHRLRTGGLMGFKNQLPLDTLYQQHNPSRACSTLSSAESRTYEDHFFAILAKHGFRVICLHRSNAIAHILSGQLSSAINECICM